MDSSFFCRDGSSGASQLPEYRLSAPQRQDRTRIFKKVLCVFPFLLLELAGIEIESMAAFHRIVPQVEKIERLVSGNVGVAGVSTLRCSLRRAYLKVPPEYSFPELQGRCNFRCLLELVCLLLDFSGCGRSRCLRGPQSRGWFLMAAVCSSVLNIWVFSSGSLLIIGLPDSLFWAVQQALLPKKGSATDSYRLGPYLRGIDPVHWLQLVPLLFLPKEALPLHLHDRLKLAAIGTLNELIFHLPARQVLRS